MTPLVQFVLPAPKIVGEKLEELRRELAKQVESDLGWSVSTMRSKVVPTKAKGDTGRAYTVLEPRDAFSLYRALHRRRVVVLQLKRCMVVLDPSGGPYGRNVVSLQRFVEHKAFFAPVNLETDSKAALRAAEDWVTACHCDGENDPRCLPMHSFAPGADWSELAASSTRFERLHGGHAVRIDSEQRRWNKTKALHGTDVDSVAGYDLRKGFHWDVDANRSASHLGNSREVWRLSKGGYLNVYPDANIRKGKLCKLAFEATRPSPELASGPSLPKQRRRRR